MFSADAEKTYSESFPIPAGGWTGQASAILVSSRTASRAGVTADVRLWRDPTDAPLRRISLAGGVVQELKIRYINFSSATTTGAIGFN